jgi:hypothetical protein
MCKIILDRAAIKRPFDSADRQLLDRKCDKGPFVHRGVKLSFGQFATLVILG